jgi:hypothetical protein
MNRKFYGVRDTFSSSSVWYLCRNYILTEVEPWLKLFLFLHHYTDLIVEMAVFVNMIEGSR